MRAIQGLNQFFHDLRGSLVFSAMAVTLMTGLSIGCVGQNPGIAAGRPIVTLPTESYIQRGETLSQPAATLSLQTGSSLAFSGIKSASILESESP